MNATKLVSAGLGIVALGAVISAAMVLVTFGFFGIGYSIVFLGGGLAAFGAAVHFAGRP